MMKRPPTLVLTHAAASLIGAWFLVLLVDDGAYAISGSDARLILITAPIAGAIASLLFDRYLLSHWLHFGFVCVGIAIIVSIALSSAVAIDSLIGYHGNMSQDPSYSFDMKHALSVLLVFNAIGGYLSAMTILPSIVVTTSAWRLLVRRSSDESDR